MKLVKFEKLMIFVHPDVSANRNINHLRQFHHHRARVSLYRHLLRHQGRRIIRAWVLKPA